MSLADFYAILRDFKSQSLVVFLHDNCCFSSRQLLIIFNDNCVFFKDNKDNGNNRKNRRNCGCHEVTYNTDNKITINGIVVPVVFVVFKNITQLSLKKYQLLS